MKLFFKAMATFVVSLGMGLLGGVLGGFIYMGVSEYLKSMPNERIATALAILIVFGSALVGGIFGLQKGARWTRLMDDL